MDDTESNVLSNQIKVIRNWSSEWHSYCPGDVILGPSCNFQLQPCLFVSGVARAFPGGRLAHFSEGQLIIKEETFHFPVKAYLTWKYCRKARLIPHYFQEKFFVKVELLTVTRDCEAGYGHCCLFVLWDFHIRNPE